MAGIALENLVKTFGAYTAVSGITLDIRDGEFLIMVGPSGCGKTTTLNMISGLETPTSGRIVIGDSTSVSTDAFVPPMPMTSRTIGRWAKCSSTGSGSSLVRPNV